jgi:hypothetical protein
MGKTKAMPAKGKVPNLPIYEVSAIVTKAPAAMANILGRLNRHIVAKMGAVVRVSLWSI